MKMCSICGEEKPFAKFYKSNSSSSGLQSRCKECNRKVLYEKSIKDENAVKANLLGAPSGRYVPETNSVRPGAMDHMKHPSLRAAGRVNQYEVTNGVPKLRSLEAEDN